MFPAFSKKLFFRAIVESDGINRHGCLRAPIKIAWSDAQCLDISSLVDLGLGLKYRTAANPGRFFLIMSQNKKLVAKGARSQRYAWFAATNVLGIADVENASAGELKTILQEISFANGLVLQAIVLELWVFNLANAFGYIGIEIAVDHLQDALSLSRGCVQACFAGHF
ncbi:MAG: hypothetical protein JNL11_08255 [Bdellovibrionaceae bacterium]|nr:hypothetical protein [Pseudobdellovibrionaceae bacterium]